MIISAAALGLLISISILLTAIAPVLLVYFWFKDSKKGDLW